MSAGAEPVLRDIKLRVQTGQLVIVSGQVGAGKTSLLAALLQELYAAKGADVSVHGQIAYTAQDPWVRNATLRDNILMGEKFDPVRYQEVLEACALVSDIALLPTGDSSEIGEKVSGWTHVKCLI